MASYDIAVAEANLSECAAKRIWPVTKEINKQGIEVFYCDLATATSIDAIEWERRRFQRSAGLMYKSLVWC